MQLSIAPSTDLNQGCDATLRRAMWRVAYRQLEDRADADDAVQDVLEALCRWRSPAIGAQRADYAYGILRHKVLDVLRERGRATAPPCHSPHGAGAAGRDGPWPGALTAPEHFASLARQAGALMAGVNLLSPRARQIVVLRVDHGMGAQEIGLRLDISANSTWVLWHRAKHRLAINMDRLGYAPHEGLA